MPDWKILDLIGDNRPPEFHLSLEELLLDVELPNPILLLYENPNAVVLGKNQNPWQEVDLEYAKTNSVPVFRRISGGGTVFHGPGNILFSFVERASGKFLIPMKDYNQRIISAFGSLGIQITEDERSCLFFNEKKISGNAQTLRNGKCLSHGTLLFDADLDFLNPLLDTEQIISNSKAVSSVRSRVGNLPANLKKKCVEEIGKLLEAQSTNIDQLNLDPSEIRVKQKKYLSWDWTFGKTPPFEVDSNALIKSKRNGTLKIEGGSLVSIRIEKEILIPYSPLAYLSREFFDYLNSVLS